MDKVSYAQRWPLEALCQGGQLPRRGAVIDESSGSSGKASNWVRGADERAATRRLIQYSARATFGEQSFVLLNAFALGPWATGMNVSIHLNDTSEGERIFKALAEGGNVTMDFQKTFWSPGFGMCVDRYGIPWMVNTDQPM